jgi:actin-like ATPase involved in cell morphogenesis
MAQLLRAVVSEVVSREGGPPSSVCVSHPANWGPYKTDLLRQAVRMADLPGVSFVTEPEAAAVNYAQEQRLGVGAVVAVYDLGGGTFDAAVLRRTANGFSILGEPEGIERLGGIDFDAAVFNHVRTTLGSKLDDLDEDDPAAIAAVGRLREECVQAKEALSADTDTTIPVLLPSVTTEVRLTRGELEAMVRPALHGSIEALQRAVRSAGLTAGQLHSVLLVGGSSRMPIVGQLVSAELGRPVAVDTHPKHAVALGAARLAGGGFSAPSGRSGPAAGPAAGLGATGVPGARHGAVGGPGAGAAAALGAAGLGAAGGLAAGRPPGQFGGRGPGGVARPGGDAGDLTSRHGAVAGPPTGAGRPVARPPVGRGPTATPPRGVPRAERTGPTHRLDAAGSPAGRGGGTPPSAPEKLAPPKEPTGPRRRALALGAVVATVVAVAAVGVWLAQSDADDNRANAAATQTSTRNASTLPPDEQCTDAIMSNPRWVCLTSAIVADGKIVIEYQNDGSPMDVNGAYHLHVYGGDGTSPPASVMGMQAPSSEQGKWYVEDQRPAVLDLTDERFQFAIGDALKVCARISDSNHYLVPDADGGYATGNCVPITRTVSPSTAVTTQQPPQTKRPPKKKTTTTTTTTTTDTTTTTTTTTEPHTTTDETPAP